MGPQRTASGQRQTARWLLVAGPPIVLACVAVKLLLHLATANRYGIFRDEMYGLACAQHLDWGYVDCPPGGIVIAWVAHHLFGDSLLGLRFLPALAGAVSVWATARLAREMGGGVFAQGLAALAFCIVPIYAIFDHWLMMNAFEPLIWIGVAWLVLRAINTSDGRYWIGFGMLAGIGIETKYSIVFLMAGIALGLALTPEGHWLRSWFFWLGLLIAALIALPNFLWQARHGFPFLELRHNIAAHHRDVVRGPLAFVADQAVIMNPVLAPLWIGGALWLLFGRQRHRYGVFGWAFLVVLGVFILLKGKNYYVSPVYPVLFAAGAVGFEWVTLSGTRGRWRGPAVAVAALSGLVLLPLVMPVLPPQTFLRYEQWLRLRPPESEHQDHGLLPQYFADEFGWEAMVREVARVYHSLPPAEQARTAIFSNSWGDAAAVDFFGPKYGLPPAICKNDSYWLWGPHGYTGEIVIVLNSDGVGDRQHFASVEKVGRVQSTYSRHDEWFDIFLCRGLNEDLRLLWPKIKAYD